MKLRKLIYLFVSCWAVMLVSCSSKDEPTPYEGTPLVILETDIGSSTDDLFALEMLYDYDRRGKCRFWA